MMNHKEFAIVKTQTEARDAAMNSARHWAADDNKYTARKTCVKFARDAIKNARKANRKIVVAKAAGTARPVSLILATMLPLMEVMAKDAADRTLAHIAKVRALVADRGLDAAFPKPADLTTNDRWNRAKVAAHDRATAARWFAAKVTGENAEDFCLKEVEDAVFMAQQQFRAYADKLEYKVGAVTEARLQVIASVWGSSYLYVTTAAGNAECWHTQTIVNRSKLDKLFYQWPTRKLKTK